VNEGKNMDELSKILAVTKAQAAAGIERIAFDPMALAHAIETGVAARVVAERERCAALCLRPPGWLSDSHQALASEIRNAILGNAGRLQGPNV
jgi:hypothetical protein